MHDTEPSDLMAQRRAKLAELRKLRNAYPNDFKRDQLAADLHRRYQDADTEALEAASVAVKVAGRMLTRRVMGKASFAHLQDMSGKIQLYLKRDRLGDAAYSEFKHWDIGDIMGAEGVLFRTNQGELSVLVDNLRLLSKSLRPLPEKFHGLADQEAKYRQRYLDLIMNAETRYTFHLRAAAIDFIRRFLQQKRFLEVETPMMQILPGGAVARPFVTHHNSLDLELYLRIAPELYLKRLLVGGFDNVFEINRNFRNEGLSTRHNPEFTMLEFYQAYADYEDAMDLTEALLTALVKNISGGESVNYQGTELNFTPPFPRTTLQTAILQYNPGLSESRLNDLHAIREIAANMEIPTMEGAGAGKLQTEIFEKTVEPRLIQPTFITAFPTEVSPLARMNDRDPTITDRFELFVAGREIANGFSELNDPEEQAQRFRRQVAAKEAGDDEAMYYDDDYIHALEYGMPPAAGVGIGIDRLVMLLSDSPSIRDVILFPHMRRKKD